MWRDAQQILALSLACPHTSTCSVTLADSLGTSLVGLTRWPLRRYGRGLRPKKSVLGAVKWEATMGLVTLAVPGRPGEHCLGKLF